jgi:hemerythrin superfamily protein
VNALDLLKQDHDRVRDLFKQIENAEGDRQAALFRELRDELEMHTKIEEEFFYPELKKVEEARELVAESYEEHHQVDVVIAEMAQLKVGSEKWTAKFTVLKEDVEHHAGEEEEEMFPKARQACKADWLEETGRKMEQMKAGGKAKAKA